jgi:small subunit ribosomal protein S5
MFCLFLAMTFPDLRMHSRILDPRNVYDLPPTKNNPYHNRVVIRNHRSVFHEYPDLDTEMENDEPPEQQEQDDFVKSLPVSSKYYHSLHQAILMRRSVVLQTPKGKIRRIAYMVLVGDGNGLVGYGLGKHSTGRIALRAAQLSAIKNMDWVERFEKRTIWTEMQTKYGATRLILRPRPVGFGLRCNQYSRQQKRSNVSNLLINVLK